MVHPFKQYNSRLHKRYFELFHNCQRQMFLEFYNKKDPPQNPMDLWEPGAWAPQAPCASCLGAYCIRNAFCFLWKDLLPYNIKLVVRFRTFNHRSWNFYICIFIYDLFLYYMYVVIHTYNIEINHFLNIQI